MSVGGIIAIVLILTGVILGASFYAYRMCPMAKQEIWNKKTSTDTITIEIGGAEFCTPIENSLEHLWEK
jgi:hypothetical protein